MMKKLLMGAVALATMQAAPVLAQTGQAQSVTIDVTGTVGSKCSTFSLNPISFSTISTSNSTGFATGGDSAATATASVWCNKAGAKVSFEHVAMKANNVTPPNASFTDTVDFTPAVKLGATDIAAAGTTVGIVADTLSVTASTNATTAIPVADSYTGTIKVTLTPGA
ncbi:hypothetical protein [Sphingobium sp.]|uniref:hypothetical protein n=1 Tax=Sphingobium sp. TaxID=1912891 RepID=UPI0035C69D05